MTSSFLMFNACFCFHFKSFSTLHFLWTAHSLLLPILTVLWKFQHLHTVWTTISCYQTFHVIYENHFAPVLFKYFSTMFKFLALFLNFLLNFWILKIWTFLNGDLYFIYFSFFTCEKPFLPAIFWLLYYFLN